VIFVQGFYQVCYHLDHPLIERYKCLEEPWPWKEDPEAWAKLWSKTVLLYCFNVFGVTLFANAVYLLFDQPVELDFSVEGLPSAGKLCGQILLSMCLEDLTFHFSHRLLHHRRIYPYIHKIHHEHKVTVAMAAQYAHPLEYMFGNILPAAVGPLILGGRMHMVTAFTWYSLRYLESAEGHSGYEFSWSPFRLLPFGSDFAYHAYHHSHNIGNYSSAFTVWDTVFGSNKTYYAYLQDRHQAWAKHKQA